MIRTQGLTRHFVVKKETVEAVRGLDLAVQRGELVALLGPNGAGKSTTVRMLTTLIPPTAGSAHVAGFDVVRNQGEVRRRIGYIGQGNGAGHQQVGRDELTSQGRAYGMGRKAARARADELISALDLAGVADRKVATLSGGQRRRLDIAMGLIHAPALLFLDEPSTGLDPQNRANLQDQIVKLRAEYGTTIVLTTHYLDEADSMAERVIVVDHGRVIADDTPARLKAEHAGDRISLACGSDDDARRASARIGAFDGVDAEHGRDRVHVRAVNGPELLPELLRRLDADGIRVIRAELARPTLDDVFLNLTGRSLREGGAEPAEPEPPATSTAATTRQNQEITA
ncbi:ATP-binding cassette domain-containing protein [Phytoactinopolyspora alkaliphila]|uniref:ATP-binding cassette domain-containing protein n=1 Tax=Phytoactinopolyspora alkaliphila TaxID=1783498 RepID=A0A6N9YKM9_9ACTN|nr:ATP-binding cassette domain-containing protein [Phytoactinopolyspora alkaliphila]